MPPSLFIRLTITTHVFLSALGVSAMVEDKIKLGKPDYKYYHNFTMIMKEIQEIVDRNPGYTKLDLTHLSRKGRQIPLLHISNFSDSRDPLDTTQPYMNSPKLKLLMSFGEHANEFFPVESMLYLLHNLTRGLNHPPNSIQGKFSRKVLSKIELFIIALANPDGRQYVEEREDYCWQGTSNGADLSLSFDWFSQKFNSGDNAQNKFHRYIEPEAELFVILSSKYRFDAFVSFHSKTTEIHIPFADFQSKSKNRKPENFEGMVQLAQLIAGSLSSSFVYGQAYYINRYPVSGTIFDYMAGVQKVQFSLHIEMWGDGTYISDKNCFQFCNPSNMQLEEELKKVQSIYENLFLFLVTWKEKQISDVFIIDKQIPSLFLCYILLGIVILITLMIVAKNFIPSWLQCCYPRRRVISLKSLGTSLHVS